MVLNKVVFIHFNRVHSVGYNKHKHICILYVRYGNKSGSLCGVCLVERSVQQFAFHSFNGNVKHECPTTRNRVVWHAHWSPVWAGIAQSAQRLATCWTVRGSNPGGGIRPDRSSGPPSLLYNGGSISGVKQPSSGVDHTLHLSPRLKKVYSYTSTPPLWLRGLL